MPQVIFRYKQSSKLTPELFERIGLGVRLLVAAAASTDRVHLTPEDIDWLPQANEPGALAPDFAIEIVTIGYPDRKAKLNRETVLRLKRDIQVIAHFIPEEPLLIWIQFLDPDGVHV